MVDGIKLHDGTFLPMKAFCKARAEQTDILGQAMASIKAKKAAQQLRRSDRSHWMPHKKHCYKTVADDRELPSEEVRREAESIAQMAIKALKLPNLLIQWVYDADLLDIDELDRATKAGRTVPWRLWESDVPLNAWVDPNDAEPVVYLRSNLSLKEIREAVPHEAHHVECWRRRGKAVFFGDREPIERGARVWAELFLDDLERRERRW